MKILVVTPYAPYRDGVAAYALQTVRRLRADGHDVRVLSTRPSAAHEHLDLVGPRGAFALAKRVRGYDRVLVQFHPELFFPLPRKGSVWVREMLALASVAGAARHIEFVVHEIDYAYARRARAYRRAARLLWSRVDVITVHTERERDDFAASFGMRPERISVMEHGRDFVPHTDLDRPAARAALGIAEHDRVALAIGFVGRHKGFDRAVRAFRTVPPEGRRLDVVGSVRVEDEEARAYRDELTGLVETTPNAHLHLGYTTDEAFDRWIVAADVVVLPYRGIWTSGVLERAVLYGRPVIASRVGALEDQVAGRPGVTFVDDDDQLAAALQGALGDRPAVDGAESGTWPDPEAVPDLRAAVQEEVVLRAAARRGSVLARGAAASGSASDREARAGWDATAPLRRLAPLPPVPAAGRAVLLKRIVRRLTGWQVDPLYRQLNALRAATLDAIERAGR